ncbi:hypothetical protein OCU04_005615 [Sclerotinia nivalis]|uniref:Uncharacterized protein n=1 Tax=Sclerotinia nivalis TaxID=352851 RepID=A0A9X0APJ6_9HELO|nr:hypothetical protein OCU04_005615 [Sclerotinia nivalis]
MDSTTSGNLCKTARVGTIILQLLVIFRLSSKTGLEHYRQGCHVVTCHYHTEGLPPSSPLSKHLKCYHKSVEFYDKPYRCPIARCEYSTIKFEILKLEINHAETQHEIIPHNLVSDYPPTEVEEVESIDETMEQRSWNEELSVYESESLKTRPESDGHLDNDYLASDLTSLIAEDFYHIGDMRAEIADVVVQDLELIKYLLPIFQAYAPTQYYPLSAESGSSSTSQSTGRTEALHSSVNSMSLVHSNTSNRKRDRPDDKPSDDEGANDPKRPRPWG